jgi:hypothetical protein
MFLLNFYQENYNKWGVVAAREMNLPFKKIELKLRMHISIKNLYSIFLTKEKVVFQGLIERKIDLIS